MKEVGRPGFREATPEECRAHGLIPPIKSPKGGDRMDQVLREILSATNELIAAENLRRIKSPVDTNSKDH